MCAVAGNIIAIRVFACKKILRAILYNIFLLNLAINDLGISLVCSPMFVSSNYAGRWMFGDIGCHVYAFLSHMFSVSSTATITIISIYKYIMICKPVYSKCTALNQRNINTNRNIIPLQLIITYLYRSVLFLQKNG